jgi:hypothetical protein
MIALIVSLLIGWLLIRLLLPRAAIYSAPLAPQLVLHVHLHLVAAVRDQRLINCPPLLSARQRLYTDMSAPGRGW